MDLAIIIPAYKITYLDKALNSLATQTNKDFKVYIGDDCSPFDISSICKKYEPLLTIDYHRFTSNLGRTNLVKQWERCVARMGTEKWLWVFSDDDIAEETCVERFYETIKITKGYYDVYRFNTAVINKYDEITSSAEESPDVENAMDLAINILLGKRGNSMPDHIFKKEKYIELNGFVDFMYGQSSDWATSIAYAFEKGLYTISGPKVRWRYSGDNVSSQAAKNKGSMIYGYMQFLKWITEKFDQPAAQRFNRKLEELTNASKRNFIVLIKRHYQGIPYAGIFKIAKAYNAIYKVGYLKALWLCLLLNLKVGIQKIKRSFG